MTSSTQTGDPDTDKDARNFMPSEITDNALVVLKNRYFLKNASGEIVEDSEKLFRRVGNALAESERNYGKNDDEVDEIAEKFYRMLSNLEFLPNSPTLMNAGTGQGTLSACFVLPLTDSMEGIMKAAHDAAMVQKFGGGTGFALSEIRPKDAPIKTTHGKACGPIAVLKLLSSVSTLVTQGGKRDGANMAVLNVHHPDILEFIDCKELEGTIHNFNISVGATDEFMKAVENNEPYNLYDIRDKNVSVDTLNAREVFNKIIHGAWRNGEPGMIFLDTVNYKSPVLHIGEITATNPCGEQPLLPNESCNLGSIDVGKFINEAADIEWDKLSNIIRLSIRFLDNVIDANKYAIPEIKHSTELTRKLGLGIMGFADLLTALKLPYDSKEALELGKKIGKFFETISDDESIKLAEERGVFPGWHGSSFEEKNIRFRNACRLTVAPTGTISMIADCSSGIEPLFALAFRKHNILGGKTLYYVNKNFEKVAKRMNFFSDDLMEYLADGGSLQQRDDVPEDVKNVFKVAADISPRDHVKMQAAFQAHVDSGISKTINFPNKSTVDDVDEAYILAWKLKCKGITVYRAGSREKEVLTTGHSDSQLPSLVSEKKKTKSRLQQLRGVTTQVQTGRGKVYITVNFTDDNQMFEVFTAHGKAGGNDSAMAEAVSRVISLALRNGIEPKDIIEQLLGITDVPAYDNGELIRSVPDAIARVMTQLTDTKKMHTHQLDSNTEAQSALIDPDEKLSISSAKHTKTYTCPECFSESLVFEEGCSKCMSCGYSRC